MKILHTADLHLDSPFSSSHIFTADKRRNGQRQVLRRIFELAKAEGCQMILIAGDLFDGKYVTPETVAFVKSLFSEADIPVIISPGNHDPFVNGSFYKSEALPENVYIFSSSELQRFDFPELHTSVFGYAFTSSVLSESPLCGIDGGESDGGIRLLCAHADLSSPVSKYCPLTVGDISALGIDYAALGHIHNRDTDDSFGGSTIRYCGFAEGRSFDELGEGGVLIVDIDGEQGVSVSRRIVSAQKYEARELDISDCRERSEIISKIKAETEGAVGDKPTHLRLTLTGVSEAEQMPDLCSLEGELTNDSLLSLELVDTTIQGADVAALSSDPTLRGEFYRGLYSGLIADDAAARRKSALALQIGLAAIDGRKITKGGDEL